MAATEGSDKWEFSCDLEVDYQSDENASIVFAALAVDKELQPDKVKREMTVSSGKLSVYDTNHANLVTKPVIQKGFKTVLLRFGMERPRPVAYSEARTLAF